VSALKSIPTPEAGSEVKSTAEVGASAAEVAREVRRQRARRLVRRLTLWVALPTLLSCVYYYVLARDQYVSFATLIVRGEGAPGSAVMLREYLQSRDLLAVLEQREHFSQHYIEHGDPAFGLSARAGSETRYESFRRAVSVRHDPSSGVVQLAVKAFSPRAAHGFARVMVEEGGRFMWSLDGQPGSARISEIARPSQPSESSYPHRGYGVLTALCVSLALFVIGSLLIMAVREHAQF
jgi:capsule polysaccharide export protein KpsE/RkpR